MIYFVQVGEQAGPVKIGFTAGPGDMPTRLRILQTGNPQKLYVAATLGRPPGGLLPEPFAGTFRSSLRKVPANEHMQRRRPESNR